MKLYGFIFIQNYVVKQNRQCSSIFNSSKIGMFKLLLITKNTRPTI